MSDKEDKVLMRELIMIKKELEIKTGKSDTEEQKKTTVAEQEKFLKMLKQKKVQNEEHKEKQMSADISKYVRAVNFIGIENINEIIEIAKDRIWKEPRSFTYINILMAAYMICGDLKKTEIEFKKGNALESNNIDFMFNSASYYFLQGKLKEAGEIITKILKIENDIDTMYLMAELLYVEGFSDKAIQIINKAVINDKNPGRLYKNIMFMIMIVGNQEKQQEILDNLIEEDGKNIAARVVLEEIELQTGNMDSYINQERIIKKLREDKEVVNMPCIHVNRGTYYRITGKYREAEEEFETAEKYYTNCICAKTERIKLYIKQKRYEEIYGSAVSALKIDLKFTPLLVELLKLCYYLRKDDKIKTILDEIISINKNSILLLYDDDRKVATFRLCDMKEKFSEILSKYTGSFDRIEVETGNMMRIYKLMRNTRMCSAREAFLNPKSNQ